MKNVRWAGYHENWWQKNIRIFSHGKYSNAFLSTVLMVIYHLSSIELQLKRTKNWKQIHTVPHILAHRNNTFKVVIFYSWRGFGRFVGVIYDFSFFSSVKFIFGNEQIYLPNYEVIRFEIFHRHFLREAACAWKGIYFWKFSHEEAIVACQSLFWNLKNSQEKSREIPFVIPNLSCHQNNSH